jgi:SPX domain protein involved in polyphosphate accumulation
MSQLPKETTEAYRHERKFLITDYAAAEVEQIIKFNPACFSEIYYPRTINNIYFDSPGFDSYYGNVEGDTNRRKARIRWYGELFGKIEKAVLEFKVKKGLLGTKEHYPLNPFTLDNDFSRIELRNALASENVPKKIKDHLLALYPTLLNSYQRKYFLSGDKKFRLTIDKGLTYHRISYNKNTFLNKVVSPTDIVLELKYDINDEPEADKITSLFPFRMTKNSKYLHGVENVLF